MSPRQKMINLMYVVLMAMLALNVSSDVLNGFSLVEDSLLRTLLRRRRYALQQWSEYPPYHQKFPQQGRIQTRQRTDGRGCPDGRAFHCSHGSQRRKAYLRMGA